MTVGNQSAVLKDELAKLGSQPANPNQLENPLLQFSSISQRFIDSYSVLEEQVDRLSSELAEQTAQKQQQYEQRVKLADRLERILATLPSAVVVIDGHGKVTENNPLAEDMLGKPLVGEAWLNIIARSFAPRSDDGHEISLKDGRRVKVETKALDTEPGQIVVLTDLTETRQLQENLSREHRLAVIGKMMASLAHQIRTPLASALLYSSQITSSRLDVEKQQRFQTNLQHSLHQLQRQVSDMLLFASGGVSTKERFSLASLVHQLETDIATSSINDQGELVLKYDFDEHQLNQMTLFGNCQALLGAINNLIDNAFHACRANRSKGRDISIEVEVSLNADAQKLLIKVTDNGSGIALSDLSKVFEPFYTSKARGTGLGLAVAKTVVSSFNGTIEISSVQGSGTQMNINLPIRAQDEQVESDTPQVLHHATGE
jgi:two-component system, sensor histidine kinase FlrB